MVDCYEWLILVGRTCKRDNLLSSFGCSDLYAWFLNTIDLYDVMVEYCF